MARKYYKGLQIAGTAFCIYNTNKTGVMPIYKHAGQTYFKPRKPAVNAESVNGVPNMVLCKPMVIGVINGFIETGKQLI
jgi:hypothetical protein